MRTETARTARLKRQALTVGAFVVTLLTPLAAQAQTCEFLSVFVNPTGGGSVTVNTPPSPSCPTGLYASGTPISVTANPNPGYAFSGWSGFATKFGSTTANPTTFTITGSTPSVTATFTICYGLTTFVNPPGGGSVTVNTGQNCTGGYTPNTAISLRANPAAGYTFSGWSGSGGSFSSTTANPTTFTITGTASVTATFTICYGLTTVVSPPGGGSVTVNTGQNCTGGYTPNTAISLRANPAAGYTFSGWSGSGGSFSSTTANPTTFTITGTASVTATFTPICYSLTTGVSPAGVGGVTVNTASNCTGGYTPNTAISLTANTPAGYTFSGWSGSGGSFSSTTANPTTFTITGTASVTVTFTAICYGLTTGVSPAGVGSVTVDTGQNCTGGYTLNTAINLTANTPAGYTFSGWSGSGGSFSSTTANPTTFTITGTASVTATFAAPGNQTLTVVKAGSGAGTVTSAPGGINCGLTCSASFAYGTSVTLTTQATSPSMFSGWSGACSGTGTCVVTMTQARNVTATFTGPGSQTLAVTKAGSGFGTVTSAPAGINCGLTCSASFAYGTSVTLTAQATSPSAFSGWSGEGCSGTGTCVVTMTQARNVAATFTAPGNQTLTVVKAGSGSGTVISAPAGISCGATCSASFAYGTSVTLTAQATSPSMFSGWSGEGCSGTGTCTVTMTQAWNVTGTFSSPSCTTPLAPISPSIAAKDSLAGVRPGGTDFLVLAWQAAASGQAPSQYQYRLNSDALTTTTSMIAEANPRKSNDPITLTVYALACSPTVTSPAATSSTLSPAPPSASFSIDRPTVAPNTNVTLTDTSSPQATSWLWLFSGGIAPMTGQAPKIQFTTPGDYQVALVASNGAGTNVSVLTTITVTGATSLSPAPAVSLSRFDAAGEGRLVLGRAELGGEGRTYVLIRNLSADEEALAFLRAVGEDGRVVVERRLVIPANDEATYDAGAWGLEGQLRLELVSTTPLTAYLQTEHTAKPHGPRLPQER